MKGFDLYEYCIDKKYTSEKNREYSQLLHTLFMHLHEDLFPLLEKAESENKRLSIKNNPKFEIIDQYTTEDVVIQ